MRWRLLSSFVVLAIALMSHGAWASSLLTYEGQIIKPDTTPLEAASVSFRVKIYNQAKTCLLWTETQTVNMTASGGNFKIDVGGGTNTATAVTDFRLIFGNTGSLSCNGGGFYSPSSSEHRTMLIEFDDDADTVYTIIDEIPVNFSPYAFHATTVGGFSSSYLFKSDSPFAATFPGAGVQELLDFANKTNLAAGISGLGGATPFGDATTIPVITVDAFGRITNVTTTSIVLPASGIAANAITNAKLIADAVTTDKIQDGTITASDLSPSAAIADTQLSTISTAGKVLNSATTATSAATANAIVSRDASGDANFHAISTSQRVTVGGQAITHHNDFGTATTLDFDTGNTQYSSTLTNCGLTLNNMQDGTNYTIILENISTSVTCTFSITGASTFRYTPSNRATVAGTTSIYRLTKIGSIVYIDWTTGIQ